MPTVHKGILLVISGPSGTGKGTICQRLFEEDPTFSFSVSATTRPPRMGEVDGVHYHFITEEQFQAHVDNGEFLECAIVHGHRYGTLRSEVRQRLQCNENVLLDIDPQGARAVSAAMPEAVTVFILPPSYAELRKRLHTRNTESQTEIARRLGNAKGEIDQLHRYQYAIINDTVEQSLQELRAVIQAEQHRTTRFFPEIPEE